jgi:hypothetical protein
MTIDTDERLAVNRFFCISVCWSVLMVAPNGCWCTLPTMGQRQQVTGKPATVKVVERMFPSRLPLAA